MQNLFLKWRELVPFYLPAIDTASYFFLLSRHSVSPLLVRASGAVALKVAQALSTRAYNLADEFINF